MSRKKQRQPPKQVKAQAQDSFQNVMARLGAESDSFLEATQYPLARLTQNFTLMNSLYRSSWITKKIINAVPDDMVKNWFAISAEMSPEEQDRYDKLEKRTKVKEKLTEGLYWGRLYGGAAALILIEGDEDRLHEELKPEDVMPNTFKGLLVVDRWSGVYPSVEIITDINDPEFGLPKYYEIRNVDGQTLQQIHHSRIIRFMGRKLPYWEEMVEIQWGASEMEHIFDELKKRDNTSWNIASLIFQANVLVNKVDGLDQLLSLGDEQAQADFYRVKSAQNKLRGNGAMMMIGKDEDVQALQYTFSGLNEIYESFMLDISGACEIPVTRLFGRSPAGMNSTGESDMQMYYDMISQRQNSELSPKLDKLLPIMFMSEFGVIPKDLGHKFNPVNTPSDDKVADIVGKKVESIKAVYDSGIINQKIAMKELHEISYTTNMFSNITDEDIEGASEEFIDETELIGGGEGAAAERLGDNSFGREKV